MSIAATLSRNRSSPATQQPEQKNLTPLVTKRRKEMNKFGSHTPFQAGTASPIPSVPRVSLFLCAVMAHRPTSAGGPNAQVPPNAQSDQGTSTFGHWPHISLHPLWLPLQRCTREVTLGTCESHPTNVVTAPLMFCAASRLHYVHQFTW